MEQGCRGSTDVVDGDRGVQQWDNEVDMGWGGGLKDDLIAKPGYVML